MTYRPAVGLSNTLTQHILMMLRAESLDHLVFDYNSQSHTLAWKVLPPAPGAPVPAAPSTTSPTGAVFIGGPAFREECERLLATPPV